MKLKKSGIPKKNLDKNDDFVYSIQYTQGHIVLDVRHVGFNMSDNRSDGDRCNKKGHKTRELSQQV